MPALISESQPDRSIDTSPVKKILVDSWAGDLNSAKHDAVPVLNSLEVHGISKPILEAMLTSHAFAGTSLHWSIALLSTATPLV